MIDIDNSDSDSDSKNNDKIEISKPIGNNKDDEITETISDDQVIYSDDKVDSTERGQKVINKLEDEEEDSRKAAELMLAIIFNL